MTDFRCTFYLLKHLEFIIVTYVPPKTNTWKLEEYKAMQEVLKCLGNMMRKDIKVLLVGDFNCKGVNWKEMERSGTEGTWSEEMLKLVMENTRPMGGGFH